MLDDARFHDPSDPSHLVGSVLVDADGTTDSELVAGGSDPESLLRFPAGGTVMRDGAPFVGPLDVRVARRDPIDAPAPLLTPERLPHVVAFAAVQPFDVTFDASPVVDDTRGDVPPRGPGADLALAIDQFWPIPDGMDVWAFDLEQGDWVNRSEQLGVRAQVALLPTGYRIDAPGLIEGGGWYALAHPRIRNCLTRVVGRITTASGAPVEGARVALETGNLATTGADGAFAIEAVETLYPIDLELCADVAYEFRVTTPVSLGGREFHGVLPLTRTGGTTNLGDFAVETISAGVLVGRVSTSTPIPAGTRLRMRPADSPLPFFFNSPPLMDSAFFLARLEPGEYESLLELPDHPLPLWAAVPPAREGRRPEAGLLRRCQAASAPGHLSAGAADAAPGLSERLPVRAGRTR